MMTNQDSAEKLSTEILTDARRRADEIVLRAKQDAEVILNNAATEADQVKQKILEQACAEAERRSELILATVPVETGRLLAARVEALLDSIYDEVCQRLHAHEGFVYRETIISLASQAIRRMTGNEFVIKLSGKEHVVEDRGLAEEIAHRAGRSLHITISHKENTAGDGVIIEDAGARQVWDNRLLKRLERLWPELRRQIALQASLVPRTRAGESSQ
ncbi:MAG: V-type ATP synthase subunit E [Desulforhabdus sp.]|jgi:V/A-type H+-transporting ATPase subunit E|nr:V-type ATP synthase subunit E [Desulforhabdus sp.]